MPFSVSLEKELIRYRGSLASILRLRQATARQPWRSPRDASCIYMAKTTSIGNTGVTTAAYKQQGWLFLD